MSRLLGIRANEESSTLQKSRPSKSGEEKGEMCKGGLGEGGEDLSRGDGEGRRASVQKLSLTRRQSRDLLKKKTSVEEQVPLVQYTWPGEERKYIQDIKPSCNNSVFQLSKAPENYNI